MNENPIFRDIETVLEYGGHEVTWPVDLDRSTVIPGSPGIYDGLVIAQWADA
jgi:hypothetical protein